MKSLQAFLRITPILALSGLLTSCESLVDGMLDSSSNRRELQDGTRHYVRSGYDVDTSYKKAQQDQFENDFFSNAGF